MDHETLRTEAFGRAVEVQIDAETDDFGQFRIALLVDGKELWAGHMTDKADESLAPNGVLLIEIKRTDGTVLQRVAAMPGCTWTPNGLPMADEQVLEEWVDGKLARRWHPPQPPKAWPGWRYEAI